MRDRNAILPVVLLVGVALSGCGRGGASHLGMGGGGICTPFKAADTTPAATASAAATDGSVNVGECLHRWAYALAPAHESADVVATAAVTACNADLANWNQQSLNPSGQQSTEATSLTTGQPVDQIGAHAQFAQSQALLYVVQARAGNCAPPPSNLLARTGG